jgi:hypothetical protein
MRGAALQAEVMDDAPLAYERTITSYAPYEPYRDGLLWPSSRMMGGEMAMGMLSQAAASNRRWGTMPRAAGGQGMQRITGTTRDSTGGVLGSVTVQIFRTSDDLYIGAVVSDAAGYFEAMTPYPATAHYLVGYKAGSPDVTGATVNTLTSS